MISRNWSDTKEEQRCECNGITLDRVVMISIGIIDQKRKDGIVYTLKMLCTKARMPKCGMLIFDEKKERRKV